MVDKDLKEINDNLRKEEILKFLSNNPGCTKEALVRGVKNIASKKTVLKILNELEIDELIILKKDQPNSRRYKLFLRNDNILIVLNKQIQDFNQEFNNFLQNIEAAVPDLILLPDNDKVNRDKNFMVMIIYVQLPLFILKYLMQCLLLKSIMVWPKIIQKNEIINKLNLLVFTGISKIISDYSIFYNNKLSKSNIHQVNYNPTIHDELNKLENNILYFAFFLLICKKKGIDKEFENVIDKIWLINSDVQRYLHPEASHYNLSYDYGKDDWRKYLKLYRQYLAKIEKLQNNKKQRLSNLIDSLND
ncbi:MAG TPA: hypothetical protein VJ697_01130 [Nitrososphaeraceae archaeon]|nr:hypothetical protein [Nitrososphaeraceae archaeon]